MRQSMICALALALAAPAASYAAAYGDGDGAVSVRLHDADLNNPGGAARVLRRLDTAALEACGASVGSLREYRLVVQRSTCHAASLDHAVAQLNAPLVTELYSGRASATN